jgi:hypothetical protein
VEYAVDELHLNAMGYETLNSVLMRTLVALQD